MNPGLGSGTGSTDLGFDPQWCSVTDGLKVNTESLCAIDAATDALHWAENLWSVDYRM